MTCQWPAASLAQVCRVDITAGDVLRSKRLSMALVPAGYPCENPLQVTARPLARHEALSVLRDLEFTPNRSRALFATAIGRR